jgi:ubiquinone/menaquinone biosynthesis C-methylase UbiE
MQPGSLVESLFADIAERHPRNRKGIEEAREIDPERFDATAERYLGWLRDARGEGWLARSVDAYAQFSGDVVMAQARYEASGAYAHDSFEKAHDEVYSQRDVMDDYLWGVYLTNFLWAHHMEIMRFFQERFVAPLADDAKLVEIAPGHGGWGVYALHARPGATLQGFDISPSSIAIASSIAGAAGVADRASYQRRNALDLASMPEACADGLICSFLVEHLEEPDRLFAVIGKLLRPGGTAFVTGVLTAAQIDHIYEFRRESELVLLAEKNGMRVRETLSVSPKRILPRAKFLPRSMAMALTKCANGFW